MKLSDFDGHFFHMIRDGNFETLRNLTTLTDTQCLSFAIDTLNIRKACKQPLASCLIVPEAAVDDELLQSEKGIAVAQNPKSAFHLFHNYLVEENEEKYVGKNVKTVIGEDCDIHPTAKIAKQNVVIGNHVRILENAIIREGVSIGDFALVKAGAILGYDACLAGKDSQDNLLPLISVGRTRIGSHVQIGSYSCAAKGLFPGEVNEIGDYTLVGAFVDISHNVRVGRNCIILDQSQICGNTVLEDFVRVAPMAIVSNRLKVAEHAEVAIGSVVVNNVKKGVRVAGNYAIENAKFLLWHRKKLREK